MSKTGHAACVPQHSQGRRRAAQASDLRAVRTGPVCYEPRHRRMEASSVGLKADILNITYDCYSQIIMSKWQHCKFDNWK